MSHIKNTIDPEQLREEIELAAGTYEHRGFRFQKVGDRIVVALPKTDLEFPSLAEALQYVEQWASAGTSLAV